MSRTDGNDPQINAVGEVLTEARKAASLGNRQRAYRLSLEATQAYPKAVDAWLLRAETAASPEETVVCLNNVLGMDPSNSAARWRMYLTLRQLLEHEPFLAYMKETKELYHVQNGIALSLVVPKERSVAEPFPPSSPNPLHPAYRWLGLAFLGLLPAGIGALVLAPVAAGSALVANFHHLEEADRMRSLIVLGIAAVIWVVAVLMSLLLVVHVFPAK